jgi:hypothetical protein
MNIIEMAREAGLHRLIVHTHVVENHYESLSPKLEKFAALVRAEALKDRYFCQRCGKRVGDKNGVWEGVHTCTPPEDVRSA